MDIVVRDNEYLGIVSTLSPIVLGNKQLSTAINNHRSMIVFISTFVSVGPVVKGISNAGRHLDIPQKRPRD